MISRFSFVTVQVRRTRHSHFTGATSYGECVAPGLLYSYFRFTLLAEN